MCKWGTDTIVEIDGNPKAIDSCIAQIVEALNRAGVPTDSSCCGHGKSDGGILLADGRALVIRDTAEWLAENRVMPQGALTWKSAQEN